MSAMSITSLCIAETFDLHVNISALQRDVIGMADVPIVFIFS